MKRMMVVLFAVILALTMLSACTGPAETTVPEETTGSVEPATEKTDPTNRPVVNGGILLKYSSNLAYTTDGVSAARLKVLCERAGVPLQIFFNRSDMMGGSTLGRISLAHVPVHSVDIGLAQLAMHSPYETAGVKDYEYLEKMASAFFS